MQWNREKILGFIESMIASLQKNKEKVNDLNVFPVPDGDTGTNMFATLSSGWNEINDNFSKSEDILKNFSKGTLFGARGNSGVIVSQIIKGFEEGIKKNNGNLNTPLDLKKALIEAKEYAYNSVSEPVEGTILTIIRVLSEKFNPKNFKTLEDAFIEIEKIAKKATSNTPNQLPILKESGVVDSGAFGLTTMIIGLVKAISGFPLRINVKGINDTVIVNGNDFIKANPTKNIGYCTEFILTLKDKNKFNKENYQRKISKIGNSIVLIQDEDILKLHIHVKNPGEILNDAQKYGEFSKVKIENMASQVIQGGHKILGEENTIEIETKNLNYFETDQIFDEKENKDKKNNYYDKNLGIIVISDGIGINEEFKELKIVDKIISGGQTMNPSVLTFVKGIKELKYKNILILPNNSNIILTAEMAKNSVKDKNIFILPTKTIPQGLVALYNINKEMVDFNNYKDLIVQDFKSISEGQITKATRDTSLFGVHVKKDEYIAIYNNEKIIVSDWNIETVLRILINKILDNPNLEILNIFYNDRVDANMINEVMKEYKKSNKDIEINFKYGGQNVYNFIVFGE
ncbi:MAG: phosphatase [Candidatus Hepatoplasma vulgare]|nr:MAG: phosphatase [Candidatus Hepatoplasma sp.]